MVGIQDTGCVTYYGIGGLDHIRRNSATQGLARRSIPQGHMDPLHPGVAKKTQHSQPNKKSENLIDADSGLTHDWRIIIASNEFVFRVSLPRIFGEKGRCITASISSRLHLSL
jgi:hypothetical protein